MLVKVVRTFGKNKYYADGWFAGRVRVVDSDDSRFFQGDEIGVSGRFRYFHLHGYYDISVSDEYNETYKSYKVLSIAEHVSSSSEMKQVLARDGELYLDDTVVDALWNEFNDKWTDALRANESTKMHERLVNCLGGGALAMGRIERFVAHFVDSSYGARIQARFPRLSFKFCNAIGRKIDKLVQAGDIKFFTSDDMFEFLMLHPYRLFDYADEQGLRTWKMLDRAILDVEGSSYDVLARIECALHVCLLQHMNAADTCCECAVIYDDIPGFFAMYLNYAYALVTTPLDVVVNGMTGEELITYCLTMLVHRKLFEIITMDGKDYIVEAGIARWEQKLANRIVKGAIDSLYDEAELDDMLDVYEHARGQVLDLTQRDAVHAAFKHTNCIIRGRAGYGKSSVIDAIAHIWHQYDAKGLSSANIRIMTLSGMASQRLRDESNKIGYTDEDVSTIASALWSPGCIAKADVVIIDEASMCSTTDLGRIVSEMSDGTHLILVGDEAQLSPVGEGQSFFDLVSKVKDSTVVDLPIMTLGVNHRQIDSSSALVSCLEAIRTRNVNEFAKHARTNCTMVCLPAKDVPTLADTLFVANRMAKYLRNLGYDYRLARVVSSNKSARKGYFSCLPLNLAIRKLVNPDNGQVLNMSMPVHMPYTCSALGTCIPVGNAADDAELAQKQGLIMAHEVGDVLYAATEGRKGESVCFRIGDRVMCHKNDPLVGVFNGDCGVIRCVRANEGQFVGEGYVEIVLDREGGKIAEVDLCELGLHWQLAYCTTVHKSQGSEYEHVIVCFAEGGYAHNDMIYTAATRAKKTLCICGSSRDISGAVTSSRVSRNTLLSERIRQ